MNRDSRITETDLHAYVDGHLDDHERERVASWLADNPEEQAKVDDWQAQANLLRNTFLPYETTHADDHKLFSRPISTTRRLPRWLLQASAACLIFVAGAVTGQLLPSMQNPPIDPAMLANAGDISHQSKSAYLIYASEVRHPVEVGANEQQHLARWLGKRLGYPFAIPDLTSIGFDLVGGRLVPVSGKPGAMLMYQDKGGQRVTVLIGHNPENRTTSFRMASADGVETFYWIDNEIGYAVSGEIAQADLQKIAEECYRQFPT